MNNSTFKFILAEKIKVGDWICCQRPSLGRRVVDVDVTREGRIKINFDYGNGGEPATSFYDRHERVVIV